MESLQDEVALQGFTVASLLKDLSYSFVNPRVGLGLSRSLVPSHLCAWLGSVWSILSEQVSEPTAKVLRERLYSLAFFGNGLRWE